MAEIRIERKQRGALPWLIGLALVALVVIGLTLAFAASPVEPVEDDGAREAGNVQEKKQDEKKKENEVPRRLQYWASLPAAGQPLAA